MQKTDEEILIDYQAGNKEAMEMIFQRYKNPVLNFCLRILGNRADAEDVTTDVFIVLLEKRYTYDPKVKFSTWLYTVARNSCISRIRRRKKIVSLWFHSEKEDKVIQQDIPDSRRLAWEEIQQKETTIYVRRAINKLPFEQREAIILREYHNLTYEQISQTLECSLEKVKILIFRAREFLRSELKSFVKEGL